MPARWIPKASVVSVVMMGSVSASPTPPSAAPTAAHTAAWSIPSSENEHTKTPNPIRMIAARVPNRSESVPANGAATRRAPRSAPTSEAARSRDRRRDAHPTPQTDPKTLRKRLRNPRKRSVRG
jgi:hypothetical protein